MVEYKFRQDGDMPRLIQPELPSDVEAAVSHFGNRGRISLLRTLAVRGPCSMGDLLKCLDMTRASVNKHLVVLENAGLIHGDPPPGWRHGKIVEYSLNKDRVLELSAASVKYVLGEPNTPPMPDPSN